MKCVIIANGDLEYTSDILRVIKDAQLIISADGGARHLRALNILPHVMIGDFDSILPKDKQFFKENHKTYDLSLSSGLVLHLKKSLRGPFLILRGCKII